MLKFVVKILSILELCVTNPLGDSGKLSLTAHFTNFFLCSVSWRLCGFSVECKLETCILSAGAQLSLVFGFQTDLVLQSRSFVWFLQFIT